MSLADKLTVVAENTDKVYQAGKDVEHKEFWTMYQMNGEMNKYNYAFYSGRWTDENFRPVLDLKVGNTSESMFNSCSITDLAKIMTECGVKFDFSGLTGALSNMFAYSTITHIPELNAPLVTKFLQTFVSAKSLVTIDKIVCGEAATFSNTFKNATALENVVFEGVIGNDIDFSYCTKLTKESILSVINALKTYTSGTHTLTLGATNKAKLTTDEIAIAENKAWTIA